jgi:hypothetical protein
VSAFIIVILIPVLSFGAGHWTDYVEEQVPAGFHYPRWMLSLGMVVFKFLLAGFVCCQIMGKDRFSSRRGLVGVFVGITIFVAALVYHEAFEFIAELGLKGIAIVVGSFLVLGFICSVFTSKR